LFEIDGGKNKPSLYRIELSLGTTAETPKLLDGIRINDLYDI